MDDISEYVIVCKYVGIFCSVLFGLSLPIHILYRTRRVGYAWITSVACTLAAALLFSGLVIAFNSSAVRIATRLGKDDQAVSIITDVTRTVLIALSSAGFGSYLATVWPTKKERAEKARAAAAPASTGGV